MEMTQYFEVGASVDALAIQLKTDITTILYAYVYNPDDLYIGWMAHGYNLPPALYYGSQETSLNALTHTIVPGRYCVHFLAPLEQEDKDLLARIHLIITTNKAADSVAIDLIPLYKKADAWFGDGFFSTLYTSANRYYHGDLHGHTTLSDGHLSPQEMATILQEKNLDYMAITDHNILPYSLPTNNTCLLPSFELTLSGGHFNIHGLDSPLLPFSFNSEETLIQEAMNRYRTQCHIALNHMFLKPWHYTYTHLTLDVIDSIEIICDPSYPDSPLANEKAIAFLDFLWFNGYRIYGIGGSDAHHGRNEFYTSSEAPSIYGDPCTYIYCKGLSRQNLVTGLKNGHVFVTRFMSLELDIHQNLSEIIVGDMFDPEQPLHYTVHVSVTPSPMLTFPLTAYFLVNGKTVKEPMTNATQFSCHYKQPSTDKTSNQFIRFGIVDANQQTVAYVNPIYSGSYKNRATPLHQLIEEFETIHDKRHII